MKKGRIEFEKKTLTKMIYLYCKGQKHGEKPCEDCKKLLDYAFHRLDNCKFGESKSFCSKCTVHCYKPEMRESIKRVMKFSGPKMLIHSPIIAIKHMFLG
jgi:hypothetical protein